MNIKISEFLDNCISLYKKNQIYTQFPKTHNGEYVLISFLTAPFTSKEAIHHHTHTNLTECKTVVDFFISKGYIVDVINWNNSEFIPKREYSVLFDIHANIDRLSSFLPKETKKILYATGSHWLVQNSAEYERLRHLRDRKGVSLLPRRQTPPCQSAEKTDHVIVLGNQTAYESFLYAKKPLHIVNLFSIFTLEWNEKKDFEKARTNYVWIGNSGLVHKGLDLVLEAFSDLPDFHLYICGNISEEKDFEEIYYNELFHTPNIHTFGWLDVHSSRFRDLLHNCIGLIYPSCSEGQSGSVITCMNGGLIPVISRYCGVGNRDCTIILEENSVEEIRRSVKKISQMERDELITMAKKSWNHATEIHTLECYKDRMHSILNSIVHEDNH
jgi:glycosyltransferase involved in cell wall biosynthesis